MVEVPKKVNKMKTPSQTQMQKIIIIKCLYMWNLLIVKMMR